MAEEIISTEAHALNGQYREAQRLVEEERNARAKACLMEIMQVAERHRCRLEAVPYITVEGRVLAQFRVAAV